MSDSEDTCERESPDLLDEVVNEDKLNTKTKKLKLRNVNDTSSSQIEDIKFNKPGYTLLIPEEPLPYKGKSVISLLTSPKVKNWIVRSPKSIELKTIKRAILNSQVNNNTEDHLLDSSIIEKCIGTKFQAKSSFSNKQVNYKISDLKSKPIFEELEDIYFVTPNYSKKRYITLKPKISKYLSIDLDDEGPP